MKREPFASAAGVKWRRYRALALLAAGLAPAVEAGAAADRQFAQMMGARLAHSDTFLAWSLDDVAERGSMIASLDRQQVEDLVGGIPRERRSVAIRSSDTVDAVDAWLFFETEAEAQTLRSEGWGFWVSARVGDLRLPTRPPFVVGYFAGTAAEQAAAQLAEDEDLHPAFSIKPLSRATPHCHIQIMCHRDLETAIEHASLASAAIEGSSCNLCVVVLQGGLPERARTRAVVRLRDTLKAGGLLVGKGEARDAFELTRTLIHELTEGQPLWRQHFKTQAGPAILLCDERMATHRLTTWTPEPTWVAHPGPGRPAGAAPTAGDGAPTGEPGGGKRFPFLPSGAELRRGAKDGSDSGRTSGGGRQGRRGPMRRQGGAAPVEPGRSQAADGDFGKVKGAPAAATPGSGWIPSSPRVVADPGGGPGDEKPGKPASRWRESKPAVGAAKALRRGRIEPTAPAAVKRGSSAPAAAPTSPEPGAADTGIRYAAIAVDGPDGEPTLRATCRAGSAVLRLSEDVVSAFVTAFEAAMSDIARDPAAYEGLRAPGTADVLRVLAQKGGALRSALERSGGLPPGVTHVQVAPMRPGVVLPVEYLYTLEPPDDDAPICDRAEEGLRAERAQLVDGWCSGCSPFSRAPEEQRRTLCPLAFWGVRCAIERRGSERASGDTDGGDHAPEQTDSSGGVLHPLRSAIVGTTERVERADAEAIVEAVRAGVGTLVEAEDWSDWEYYIKGSPTPTMLVLLARLKHDLLRRTPQLEIGAASTLGTHALRVGHVRPDEDAAPPLALLLGSETGLSDIGFESFAASFQAMGAIVVSSIAPIGAHQAAPVAAELIGAIARARQAVPLAALISDVRGRLLVDGTPVVLSLVALSDADWSVDGAV
jgi:hypothetical protein